MNTKPGLPWTEAAEQKTVTSTEWYCKTCNRRWGKDEHMARYCCATDRPCDKCGTPIPGKLYILCNGCRDLQAREKWSAKAEVPWNGEFPVALWDNDQFFWDMEELCDWLAGVEIDDGTTIEDVIDDLMLTTCRDRQPRAFEISDLLEDYLAEDMDAPTNSELEKQVNDWVAANVTRVCEATGQRIRMADIKPEILEYWNAHSPD